MDGDHPPGNGRGTPPTGHDRGKPPNGDPSLWGTSPPFSDGQASGGDGLGSTSRGDEPGHVKTGFSNWTNFWGVFAKLGVDGLVGRVREKLNTSGAMDKSLSVDLPGFCLYHDTVLGPPMTRTEEIQLKQHLEHGLRQVQFAVKAMGLQPVELHDVEILQSSPSRRGAVAGVRHTFFNTSGMRHAFESRNVTRSSSRNFEADLEKVELQKKELVSAYEKFSAQFKMEVAAAHDNNHITPEFAQELEYLVECYKQNVTKALNAGGNLLTLKCLLGRINMADKLDSWFDNAKFYGSVGLFVVTVIGGAIQCVGTSPVQFKSIGKEARRLLDHDFTFDKLKLNCDHYDKVSFGAGYQVGGQQTVGELMLKCKDNNNSFSINLKSISDNIAADGGADAPAIPNNDIATARVSLDKLCGSDTRCLLKMPFPSLNAKFEVRHGIPYAVCSGGAGLVPSPGGRIPVLDFSAVGGFKYVGFGAHCQLREGERSTTFGMSLTTEKLAVGLTYKSPSNYNATIWKKIVDSSTTIAAQASYKPQPADNEGPPADAVDPAFRFTLGLKHAVDPTLYCKARVGTDGASVVVKKSSSDGMVSIKGAVHLDFNHPRRVPKMGVVCSFRS